ncbi:hypothetical protein [Phytoactinopolyspora halophila]|nr:hypothetical protein [Phytoactinopolyspora halophila]
MSLFARFNVSDGLVAELRRCDRAAECRSVLVGIDMATPNGLDNALVRDN